MGSDSAMSDARLDAIRQTLARVGDSYGSSLVRVNDLYGNNLARELLADNERLRAREAALVAQNAQAMAIVEALDALGWDAFIGRELWGQARALLASDSGEAK